MSTQSNDQDQDSGYDSLHNLGPSMNRAPRMPKNPVKIFAFWKGFMSRIDGDSGKVPQPEMSMPSKNQDHGPDSNSSCDQGQRLPPDTYDPDDPDDPDLTPEQTEHRYRFFARANDLTLLPTPTTAQIPQLAAPEVPLLSLHQPLQPQIPPPPQGQERKRPGEELHAPAKKEARERVRRLNLDSSSNSNCGLTSRRVDMRNYDIPQVSKPGNVQQQLLQGGYYRGHAPQFQPLCSDPYTMSTSRGLAQGQLGGKSTEIPSSTREDWILTPREVDLNIDINVFDQAHTYNTQYQSRDDINRQYALNNRSVRESSELAPYDYLDPYASAADHGPAMTGYGDLGEDFEPGPFNYPDPHTSAPQHGSTMTGYGGAQSVTRQPFLTNSFSSLNGDSRLNCQGPIHGDDSKENHVLTPSDVVVDPNSAAPRSSRFSVYCLSEDPRNNADLQLLENNPTQFIQTREELLSDLEILHRLACTLQCSLNFYVTLKVNLPVWNETVRSKYVKRLKRAANKYGDIPGFKFETQQKILKNEGKTETTVQNSSAADIHGQGLTPPIPKFAPRLPDPFPVMTMISPVPPHLRRGPHISRAQGNTGFQSSPHFPIDPQLLNSPHLPVDPQILDSPHRISITPNPGTQLADENQNVPNAKNAQARANSLGVQGGYSANNTSSSTNESSSAQNTASRRKSTRHKISVPR